MFGTAIEAENRDPAVENGPDADTPIRLDLQTVKPLVARQGLHHIARHTRQWPRLHLTRSGNLKRPKAAKNRVRHVNRIAIR